MFDRFKKSLFGDNDKAPKDETGKDADGPSMSAPGGFGRRQTPVDADKRDQPMPHPSAAANSGFGRRAAPLPGDKQSAAVPTPSDQQRTITATVKGDNVAPQIENWLMAALRDERGIHCETLLTVIGAIGGYAAQQVVREGIVKAGIITEQQAFMVVGTKSGEQFYFGEATNMALAATGPNVSSFWGLVGGGAHAAGAKRLPDITEIFKHCSETVGTAAFGVPRLPRQFTPKVMPRQALNECWATVHTMLKATAPATWAMQLGVVAHRLIVRMKDVVPPDIAATIVMEAAVPMSKIDPQTVPMDTTR